MKFIFSIIVILVYHLTLETIYPQNTNVLDSLNLAVNIAEESGDSLEIARANFKIGRYYSYNDVDTSYYYLNRALKYAKAIKYDKAIGLISNIIASNYSDQGRHDEALELYNSILIYFENGGYLYQKAAVLMNIGLELSVIGRYSEAIQKQLTALELIIESGDSSNIAGFYSEIGILFSKIGNHVKFEEYLNKAYQLSNTEKYANFYTRSNITNELANVYEKNGDYENALKLFRIMYNECKDYGYKSGTLTALVNLARIKKDKKEYVAAKQFLLESLEVNQDAIKLSEKIIILARLGEIDFLLNNIVASEKNLSEALYLAEENQYSEELKITQKLLYQMYLNKKDYKKAFEHQSKYIFIKDSLESLSVKEQFAEMETRFKVEQKEKTIELLNNENILQSEQMKNQLFLFGGISVLITFVGLFMFGLSHNKKIKADLTALQYKQSMLRSQLNPHFIFNSLNSIQNFILKNKSFESADYLSGFSRLMRLILESSREDFIPLENEILQITEYLKLQQLRFDHKFNFSIDIEENIDVENLEIPGMLLQPFIENSIEHGLKNCEIGKGEIIINVYSVESNLYIQIIDNGIGIHNTGFAKERTSYSTKITSERIENILKVHKLKITFQVLPNECSGTKVIFIMENIIERNL